MILFGFDQQLIVCEWKTHALMTHLITSYIVNELYDINSFLPFLPVPDHTNEKMY